MARMIDGNPWLGRLSMAAASARATGDAEAVHELRSATRRLDAWLRLGGRRALRDDLRWLRREAAAVRDLDIALEAEAPALHLDWLRARREVQRLALRASLDGPRWSAIASALPLVPPVEDPTARAQLAGLAARALERTKRFHRAPSDPAKMHDLRRSLRVLRYAQGFLGREPKLFSRLQDALGAVGDAAVRLSWLAVHKEEVAPRAAGLAAHREALDAALGQAATTAAEVYGASRKDLRQSLSRWSR